MKGFTLLEFIISMAVLALLVGILSASFGSFKASGQLTEANSQILGMLRDARSRTLSSSQNSSYGVRFETDRAVLFKGDVYSASDPANEVYLLPNAVRISSINLTAGAAETVFTRLEGTTTASGTVTLKAATSGLTKTITILSAGLAE